LGESFTVSWHFSNPDLGVGLASSEFVVSKIVSSVVGGHEGDNV